MFDFEKLKSIFNDYPYIAAAYLFGSHAKDKAGPMSDVDIAILLKDDAPKGLELIHAEDYLAYRIEKALGYEKEVDIIGLNSKGLVFQHNVLRTGRLIYEADRDLRVKFTARVISRFCDFEPRLRYMESLQTKSRKKRLAGI